jgi:hypothetical protein
MGCSGWPEGARPVRKVLEVELLVRIYSIADAEHNLPLPIRAIPTLSAAIAVTVDLLPVSELVIFSWVWYSSSQ